MSDLSKILIVDDRPENLFSLKQLLSETPAEVISAGNGNEALIATLCHDFALAILDVQMPEMDGYELAQFLRSEKRTRQVPIIFVSAVYSSVEHVFKGYDSGAVDFLVKPFDVKILLSKVDVFLKLYRQKQKIERSKELIREQYNALQASEHRFETLVNTIPDIVYRIDPKGQFTFVNNAVEKLGYTPKELIGIHFSHIIMPADLGAVSREKALVPGAQSREAAHSPFGLFDERRTGIRKTTGLEIRLIPKSGSHDFVGVWERLGDDPLVVEVNSSGFYTDQVGKKAKLFLGTVGVVRDITVRKKLEDHLKKAKEELEDKVAERTRELTEKNKALEQEAEKRKDLEKELIQAHKMEAIGTLAGGIAHDFNNILTSLLGYTQIMLETVEKDSSFGEDLNEVYSAGLRAKELVRQILTFARQTEDVMMPVRIDLILKEALKLLRSSIPSTIKIREKIISQSKVMANATQIHQVIMNLCTNAGHAMGDTGGILTLVLEDTRIDRPKYSSEDSLEPGEYMRLAVTDTGTGIQPEIMNRIFEPYFTTKSMEEGTGMGLALVQGIVNEAGGFIAVDSTVGSGTTFEILLPITTREKTEAAVAPLELVQGKGCILIVDDEVQLTKLMKRMLANYGYAVATFNNPVNALKRFKEKPETFDAVISDLTMPELRGDKLLKEIQKIRHDIPTILCTGYGKKLTENAGIMEGVSAMVLKPLEKQTLVSTVQQVLKGETLP